MLNWFKKKSSDGDGPDFSAVDSKAKAEALFQTGELSKLYLMPPEFGGEDIEPNVVYVPPFAAEIKTGVDNNVIMSLAAQGQIKQYEASPQYQGNSFVPCAIKVVASDPGHFSNVIRIWGDGLKKQ